MDEEYDEYAIEAYYPVRGTTRYEWKTWYSGMSHLQTARETLKNAKFHVFTPDTQLRIVGYKKTVIE